MEETQGAQESKCPVTRFMKKLEGFFNLRKVLDGFELLLPIFFIIGVLIVAYFALKLLEFSFYLALISFAQGMIGLFVSFWLMYVLIDIRDGKKHR
ncbi:MAG: hypothetical protein CSA19_01065 [Deltaproteobacteria bacterium]|nr:MAG: hypothetical protein CSA19_01065 [Deltaproteobacteria bacterium]